MPDTSTTPVDTCCDRHHYSCHLGEDGPPIYCCGACPARSKLNSRASIGPDSERIRELEAENKIAVGQLEHVTNLLSIERDRAAGLLPGPDDIVVSREDLREHLFGVGRDHYQFLSKEGRAKKATVFETLAAALSQPHPAQEQQT